MVYLTNTQGMLKSILEKLEKIESILSQQNSDSSIRQPMNIEDASKFLGYSKAYLYKMTCNRQIPYYRPNGKKIVFKKSELEEWIFKHRIKSHEDIEKEADEYIRKHPFNASVNKRRK
jgi:excisionase family DNA binding protein